MKLFSKIWETTEFIQKQKDLGKTVGFVPTMGALHQGHLELMKQAKSENDLLVVSIFVNPIQFNNKSDLLKYPKNLDIDISKLKEVNCDVLFVPSVEEMYPRPINKEYDFGSLGEVMEGSNRPGHFNGVAIVVKKLFDICLPNKSYFGEKDFQQLAIIKKLVKMENLDVEIIACPIVREEDGLAMSSRNERLTKEDRDEASFIYKTLVKAKKMAENNNVADIKTWVNNEFKSNKSFNLEYFEISEDVDLQPVSQWNTGENIMGFVVAHMGKIRLIDNIRLFDNFAQTKKG